MYKNPCQVELEALFVGAGGKSYLPLRVSSSDGGPQARPFPNKCKMPSRKEELGKKEDPAVSRLP